MTTPQDTVVWTIKVDKKIDDTVQHLLKQLGYKSKAELTREAIREFLIRRKLFSLLGGEPMPPITPRYAATDALNILIAQLQGISEADLEQEVREARSEVAKELLDEPEN
ncbi:MAG: ribbon-helix-helix domain-containing protein [Candidatus Thorarchaeota archaeon]